MMTSPYRVKLDAFEGPLDLLLHLIKRNEVEIVDIPVARITEQYMAYIEMMRELNLDVAGEYLVMAATLTLIKSRMLLPTSDEEGDEEEADPRADLVRQLLEYQRYREAALALAERPLLHRDVFVREPFADVEVTGENELPRLQVSTWELLAALKAVLQRARPEAVHEVVTERVSLRERAQALLDRLVRARVVDFESLFDDATTRLEMVVTFLALLELMKMGGVRAVQADLFGRIVVELATDDPASVSFALLDEYDGGVRPPDAVSAGGGTGEPAAGEPAAAQPAATEPAAAGPGEDAPQD